MEDKRHRDRRHSLDPTAANMLNQERRVSFSGNDEQIPYQPQNRRHSVMILPNQQPRRMSLDPRHQRRTSKRFSILTLHEFSATTFSGLPLQTKPVIKVENTFKLLPDPGTEFQAHVVRKETEKIVERVLEESNYLITEEKKQSTTGNPYFSQYDDGKGGKLAKQLVSEVKDHLKTLNIKRYKLVVNAFVGTNCGQGMVIASRSLWNTDTDGHITVVRKNAKKYAIVTVHAAYYE